MRYLCLIYHDEGALAALPEQEMNDLNARHLAYNEELLRGGRLVEAEALEPAAAATCVRLRNGRVSLTDGPYAETKEMIAGFYLVEARDLNEAIQIAAHMPSAHRAVIEVRPCRDLVVDGTARKASRRSAPAPTVSVP